MNAKIFVVEDLPEMAELISLYLKNEQMQVECFYNAESALEELHLPKPLPNLIVLDLNLPGISGFDFLEKFRTQISKTIPVVIVSARDEDEDVIRGLGLGADEFVTKPFSPRVLVARISAILTRHNETAAAVEKTIKFGPFTIFLNSCILKKDSLKIPLSIKEYEILEDLAKNAGQTLSPEKIYNDVWKTQFGDYTEIAVYIQRLRKKIEENPSHPVFIKTVPGMGYKLILDSELKSSELKSKEKITEKNQNANEN